MKISLKRVSTVSCAVHLCLFTRILITLGLSYKPSTNAEYNMLNEKIERMSKWTHFALMKATVLLLSLPLIVMPLVDYFVYDLGDESFEESDVLMYGYKHTRSFEAVLKNFQSISIFRVPFNTNTPRGYLFLLLIELAGLFCSLLSFVPTLCVFIGSCWIFMSIVEDITDDLNLLNVGGASETERFLHMVTTYLDVRQLSINLN